MWALLTALKASARFLWVAWVTLLLEVAVLDSLLVEVFFALCGSAAGGTCSLFCFFAILSKPSYSVSDILIGGTEAKHKVRASLKTSRDLYHSLTAPPRLLEKVAPFNSCGLILLYCNFSASFILDHTRFLFQ